MKVAELSPLLPPKSTPPKKQIKGILRKYVEKYMSKILQLIMESQQYNSIRNQFVNKLSNCFLHHVQIMILVFETVVDIQTIYQLSHQFFVKFYRRLQMKILCYKNNNNGNIYKEIISHILKEEIEFCLLDSFSFFTYME